MKKAKVKQITVARLYNLGDYEHVRYELTAEVPAGIAAAKVMSGLMGVLNGLSPKCPVSRYSIEDLKRKLAMPRQLQESNTGLNGAALDEQVEAWKKELAELEQDLQKWKEARLNAKTALDDLTGKDAKELPF
jgi:hypothetical protein